MRNRHLINIVAFLFCSLSYQLYCFLARQMLDVQSNGEHTAEAVFQFLLQGLLLVRIIAVAEDSGDGVSLL